MSGRVVKKKLLRLPLRVERPGSVLSVHVHFMNFFCCSPSVGMPSCSQTMT